nr:hypothetical protein 56 [bacterium]
MKKRAYRSDIPEGKKPVKDIHAPIVMREDDVSAEGANGFNLLEMGIEGFGQDPEQYDRPSSGEGDQPKVKQVIDLLVELGDAADAQDNQAFADFADYLLVKYAEAKEQDPTILFNQLMIKIANADIADTNDVLKKLTKIFSRTVLLEYNQHNDLIKAKKSAYKKVVHRADQYVSE